MNAQIYVPVRACAGGGAPGQWVVRDSGHDIIAVCESELVAMTIVRLINSDAGLAPQRLAFALPVG